MLVLMFHMAMVLNMWSFLELFDIADALKGMVSRVEPVAQFLPLTNGCWLLRWNWTGYELLVLDPNKMSKKTLQQWHSNRERTGRLQSKLRNWLNIVMTYSQCQFSHKALWTLSLWVWDNLGNRKLWWGKGWANRQNLKHAWYHKGWPDSPSQWCPQHWYACIQANTYVACKDS